jgi:hypothetical protein
MESDTLGYRVTMRSTGWRSPRALRFRAFRTLFLDIWFDCLAMWPLRLKASLSAQNNVDKYAYTRSGTKIKSDVFIEGRECCFGCDCWYQVFLRTHPLYLFFDDFHVSYSYSRSVCERFCSESEVFLYSKVILLTVPPLTSLKSAWEFPLGFHVYISFCINICQSFTNSIFLVQLVIPLRVTSCSKNFHPSLCLVTFQQ